MKIGEIYSFIPVNAYIRIDEVKGDVVDMAVSGEASMKYPSFQKSILTGLVELVACGDLVLIKSSDKVEGHPLTTIFK